MNGFQGLNSGAPHGRHSPLVWPLAASNAKNGHRFFRHPDRAVGDFDAAVRGEQDLSMIAGDTLCTLGEVTDDMDVAAAQSDPPSLFITVHLRGVHLSMQQ